MVFLCGLSPCGVASKCPRYRKLTKFVPYHVLGNQERDVLAAIVYSNGQADKFRHDD
jgi:hypothetical protein